MNYLVHLYLAGPDKMHRLGAIMGDFVKGPLPSHLPEKIRIGLKHHRRIDSLAHVSVYTRRSRQRLDSRFSHTRAILVDVFYDHLLARYWDNFHSQKLEIFAAETYRLLSKEKKYFSPALKDTVMRMIDQNWLVSYRQKTAIHKALTRIAARLSRKIPMADAMSDFEDHQSSLLEDFKLFMAEAITLGREEFSITLESQVNESLQ